MKVANRRLEGAEGAGRRRTWWAREGGLLPPPEGLSMDYPPGGQQARIIAGNPIGVGLSLLIPVVFFGFIILKGISKVR